MVRGLLLIALLLFGAIQSAHADRFSDWLASYYENEITELELKKRGQEQIASDYQKEVLRLDYSKIQNFGIEDKKFTAPVETDVKEKKQIQRYVPSLLKY